VKAFPIQIKGNSMKIIALSGWAHSGKDTCAQFLIDNHGFTRLAFADVLKDMTAEAYNVSRDWFDDVTKKEAPLFQYPAMSTDSFADTVIELIEGHLRTEDGCKATDFYEDDDGYLYLSRDDKHDELLYHTPRSLLVLEGSTKRTVDPNYWVKRAVSNATPEGLYVISDLRFQSEVDGLKEAAGDDNVITMRVLRFESTDQTDASERDLDHYDFDHYIDNSEARQVPKEYVFKQVTQALKKSNILA
jgi:hypothetical protein